MAKEKGAATVTFFQDLFQVGFYKPSQGKMVRQLTFGAIALAVGLGAYQLYGYLAGASLQLVLPLAIAFVGFWLAYRIVHYQRFADFLISVEAELAKVSWPSKDEVIRSTIVVIVVIFSMAGLLFAFDLF